MRLDLFIRPGGRHEAAWRYHGSRPDRLLDIGLYQEPARRAEAAKLDVADLDRPVPREAIDTGGERGGSSRFRLIVDVIERERPTLRQLLHRLAGARGHYGLPRPRSTLAGRRAP